MPHIASKGLPIGVIIQGSLAIGLIALFKLAFDFILTGFQSGAFSVRQKWPQVFVVKKI